VVGSTCPAQVSLKRKSLGKKGLTGKMVHGQVCTSKIFDIQIQDGLSFNFEQLEDLYNLLIQGLQIHSRDKSRDKSR
jgi:hypothetical protein